MVLNRTAVVLPGDNVLVNNITGLLHIVQISGCGCYVLVTRHLANFLTLAGRFPEASDLYRGMGNEFKTSTGTVRLHAAAVTVMYAITTVSTGESTLELTRNLKSTIIAYNEVGRPCLIVRDNYRPCGCFDWSAVHPVNRFTKALSGAKENADARGV